MAMTKNQERKIILLVLGFVGLCISIATGLAEHLPVLQSVCADACRETAEMTLLSLPFWIWGTVFYAAVVLFAWLAIGWVPLIVAAAFGMELALVGIMVLLTVPCVFCIANSAVVVLLLVFSFSRKKVWQEATLILFILPLSFGLISFQNKLFVFSPAPRGPEIVARVGSETITSQRLEVSLGSKLFDLRKDVYRMERDKLDQLIVDTIIQNEARASGKTLEQFLDETLPPQRFAVTDQEVNKYLEENQDRLRDWMGSAAELKSRVKNFLQQQKRLQGMNSYAQSLEKKYGVEVFLPVPQPPQVKVNIEGAPTAGPVDAAVTVIEFSDYECPACRANHHDVIKNVKAAYGDKVKWVFKDYPLRRHKDAFKAAEAAHCAADQGHFWDYQDVLFSAENLEEDSLVNSAASLGVAPDKMRQCLQQHKYKEYIEKEIQEATRVGVDRTPSFIINGTVHVGGPAFETFKRILDEELKKAEQKKPEKRKQQP